MKLSINHSLKLWLFIVLASCSLTAGILYFTGKEDPLPTASYSAPIVNDPVPQRWVDPTAPAPMSKRIVEYHISVALQTDTNQLSGSQTLTWENPGAKPVSELYFHLYPNAFESKKTTFFQESGGKLRQDEHTQESFGSMELLSVKTVDGLDLTDRIQYVQPDDGNIHDRTLIRIVLPGAVQPGQTVTLSMDYTVQLPRVFARMGYADEFYMAGQWFPKIAVYEPAGRRGRAEEGWNLHQYHGNSEFYADFGIYDVKIKVPSNYTVAATGFPTKNAVEQNGTKTYRFYADDVHDFAWAASPNFVYHEEPFSTEQIPGVKIKLYLDPKHEHLKQRYMQAAKKSLARYSEWYGSYPYSTLSIVVPPGDANGAGGMEYPTLITAWGAVNDCADLSLERVIVHEIGHQFFYGMVASNEFEEAWLDEGFTSYAEDKIMEKEFGIKPNIPVEASYITSPAPLTRNAWDYSSHSEYAENVYTRGKLVLMAVEKEIGEQQMNRVMRTYFQRWKFRHPATENFREVLEEVTKKDWQPFFDQFVGGKEMIDYSVENIVLEEIEGPEGKPQYEHEVKVVQKGARHHTVPIRFYFEDGTVLDKTWDSQGSQIVFKLVHDSQLSRVVIDPEHTLVLENKHINNYMNATVDSRWSIRLNVGLVKLLEILFNLVS
ncbi:M1 family metallopeptidase [Paenibacillus senegalensis]|uniref:M1 family metallopeptidase n=1 Tax=Paenibacillus senegalensis TaxID=1465766 RepID=UPI000289254E|nr:M1 family metallopeptidase [Paenibacillus senegalensis]